MPTAGDFDRAAVEAYDVVAEDLDPVVALRALIVEMAAIIQRCPVLAVATDWQPAPGSDIGRRLRPVARRMHPAVFALVRGRDGVLRLDLALPAPCMSQRGSPAAFVLIPHSLATRD